MQQLRAQLANGAGTDDADGEAEELCVALEASQAEVQELRAQLANGADSDSDDGEAEELRDALEASHAEVQQLRAQRANGAGTDDVDGEAEELRDALEASQAEVQQLRMRLRASKEELAAEIRSALTADVSSASSAPPLLAPVVLGASGAPSTDEQLEIALTLLGRSVSPTHSSVTKQRRLLSPSAAFGDAGVASAVGSSEDSGADSADEDAAAFAVESRAAIKLAAARAEQRISDIAHAAQLRALQGGFRAMTPSAGETAADCSDSDEAHGDEDKATITGIEDESNFKLHGDFSARGDAEDDIFQVSFTPSPNASKTRLRTEMAASSVSIVTQGTQTLAPMLISEPTQTPTERVRSASVQTAAVQFPPLPQRAHAAVQAATKDAHATEVRDSMQLAANACGG